MKRGKGTIRKEQILCLFAGALLAVLAAVFGETKDLHREGEAVTILRPGYGEEDREQTVVVNGEEISFTVTGRKYTEEEAEEILSRLTDMLCSLDDPERNSSYDGYEGVRAEWSEEESGLFCRLSAASENGIVKKELLFPAEKADGESKESEFTFDDSVREALALADSKGVTEQTVTLPKEAGGVELSYGEKPDPAPLVLLVLSGVFAAILGKRPAEERKKRQKEREAELMRDYSDVVSRLLIYLGAGLTVRNALKKLVENDPEARGAAFAEVSAAVRDMENGIPEEEALSAFASRCGLSCYARLASLLERSQKTGGNSVKAELEMEMREAFVMRKEAARRTGEEAGTRLLLPLMMSLAAVLLVAAVPAFLKMQM